MSEKIANIIIALLSVSVFIVMILFVALPSISYFQDSANAKGEIVVGEASFEFVNDLPLFSNLTNFIGGEINEPVTVINARDKVGNDLSNLVDCYLRFKLQGSESVTPIVDENIFTKDGDYFYYNGTFAVGQNLQLISRFNVDNVLEEEYINGIDLTVEVEVMQATKTMINDIFTNAPQSWIDKLS